MSDVFVLRCQEIEVSGGRVVFKKTSLGSVVELIGRGNKVHMLFNEGGDLVSISSRALDAGSTVGQVTRALLLRCTVPAPEKVSFPP